MEKSSKRGKIPQSDWPLIMARYETGETLASIARTYDCSPPAISYIVSRSRSKPANETPQTAPAAEPQLIKTHPLTGAASGGAPEPKVAPAAETQPEPVTKKPPIAAAPNGSGADIQRDGVGAGPHAQPQPAPGRPPTPSNGEARPKLHLGFGNGHGNGAGNGSGGMVHTAGDQRPQQDKPPVAPRDHAEPGPAAPAEIRPTREISPQMARDHGENGFRKEGGSALDRELRARVDGDVAAFLAAFDAVLAADTQESRFGLREATDRLLRAGARTRIELERLEARAPLTPRDNGRPEPAWRYR
jgi:hypothetical protein